MLPSTVNFVHNYIGLGRGKQLEKSTDDVNTIGLLEVYHFMLYVVAWDTYVTSH
jgi:hypothetical protein